MNNWVASRTETGDCYPLASGTTGTLPCVTRHLSRHNDELFAIEKKGLHAVLLVGVRRCDLCMEHSRVIFQTRITDRSNPRGYLQCGVEEIGTKV